MANLILKVRLSYSLYSDWWSFSLFLLLQYVCTLGSRHRRQSSQEPRHKGTRTLVGFKTCWTIEVAKLLVHGYIQLLNPWLYSNTYPTDLMYHATFNWKEDGIVIYRPVWPAVSAAVLLHNMFFVPSLMSLKYKKRLTYLYIGGI